MAESWFSVNHFCIGLLHHKHTEGGEGESLITGYTTCNYTVHIYMYICTCMNRHVHMYIKTTLYMKLRIYMYMKLHCT